MITSSSCCESREMYTALVISALAALVCSIPAVTSSSRIMESIVRPLTRENCSATTYCPDGYHCCTTTTCCLYGYICCGGGYYCCLSSNEIPSLPAPNALRIS